MTLVERQFRPIDAPHQIGPLSAFLEHPAIVLLGDPGSGKTTSFRNAAETEPSATYCHVRDFLSLSIDRWRSPPLYIDALDEQRSHTSDGRSVLDLLRGRLDLLGTPAFRLSCRAADWYGEIDAERLREVSPDRTLCVLQIEPLSDQDVGQIVQESGLDSASFIHEAQVRGVESLLRNPQTLNLLVSVVREQRWPVSRSELFTLASEVLARETNPEHERAEPDAPPIDKVVEGASFLCAIALCSGAAGFALSSTAADEQYLNLLDLTESRAARIAASRRLFTSVGSERVEPIHRTVAEFLGAECLSSLISKGLPPERILSLILGQDGGTLPELRGLFANLACTAPNGRALFSKDPFGTILYGDPSRLTGANKRALIEELAALAARNPWFRAGDWSARPFGALASTETALTVATFLAGPAHPDSLVSCLINAAHHGPPLPALAPFLAAILHDPSRTDFLRVHALEALIHQQQIDLDSQRHLLVLIASDRISDPDKRLRGTLLSSLYPDHISVAELPGFLVPDSPTMGAAYWHFLDGLPRTTPRDQLRALMSDLPGRIDEVGLRDCFTWRRTVEQLLFECLNHFGEDEEPATVLSWLQLTLGAHGERPPVRDEGESTREWLRTHDTLVEQLYEEWIGETEGPDLWRRDREFWELLYHIRRPSRFDAFLFGLATDRTRPFSARRGLFEAGVLLVFDPSQESQYSIDELDRFVIRHPDLAPVLEQLRTCEISPHRIRMAEHHAERRRSRLAARRNLTRNLEPHCDAIAAGTHVGALAHLAKIFFGRFSDIDTALARADRIREYTSERIGEAAVAGFLARSETPENSPYEIGKIWAKEKIPIERNILLAGLAIRTEQEPRAVLSLQEDTQKAAIAYQIIHPPDEEECPWLTLLIETRPEVVGASLLELWRALFEARCQHIPGLFQDETLRSEIVATADCQLLRVFRNAAPANLGEMLRRSLAVAPETLRPLIPEALETPGATRGEARLYWLVSGVVLDPQTFGPRLRKYMKPRTDMVVSMLDFALKNWDEGNEGLSVETLRVFLAIALESRTPKEDEEPSEFGWGHDVDVEFTRKVQGLLHHLANLGSADSGQLLADLSQASAEGWSPYLAHALAEHSERRRAIQFSYPSPTQVLQTLQGGQPFNAKDLQAVLVSGLHRVRAMVRDGGTDSYRAFWNVDSHDRVTEPRPENDCRDRVIEYLGPIVATARVTLEPEGNYSRDKRADIKAICETSNIPIEIKRSHHADLWDAADRQLKRLYSRDPGADGRGIYLVLWFGDDYPTPRQSPERGRPTTPEQVQERLSEGIAGSDKDLLSVVVLDVSA